MILPSYKHKLGFFVGILMFSTYILTLTYAQPVTTFSGRVVNEDGKPVIGISVVLGLYSLKNDKETFSDFIPLLKSKTNRQGEFSLKDIPPEPVRLFVNKNDLKTSMLSIEIGNLTLHPNNHPPITEIKFSLEPGTELENAVIKVRTNIQPQIYARIVSADGTPIENASIRYKLLYKDLDGIGSGSSGNRAETDAEGYLSVDLEVDDEPKYYRLGVEYQGYFAKTEPFILHEGQPEVYRLLKLNERPIPEEERTKERITAELEALLEPASMWVINPENRHAYKKIYCHSIEDAIAKVTAENAYLVSFNNKAEEEWVTKIFGKLYFPEKKFWIGLSYKAEAGKWAWHSGEPITYTNWEATKQPDGNIQKKTFAIVGFSGQWEMVEPGKRAARSIYKAILEKEDVPVKTSIKAK